MSSFYTKIAGVTFEGRQEIIKKLSDEGKLSSGQKLELKREPDNLYDKNAIALLHPDTMQKLGYIGKDLAATMTLRMHEGVRYSAEVSQVTGGDGYSYGVNIIVFEETKATFNSEDSEFEESEENIEIEEGNDMYSRKLYESVCRWLDKGDFSYETDQDEGAIFLSNIKIESTIGKINVLIRVRTNDLVFYASPVAFAISSENIQKVGELCLRINEQYLYPTLDVSFSDNTICSKTFFACGDRSLDENEFGHNFLSTGLHFEKYGNAIMAVSLGFQQPLEALENIKDE